jgi:predicted ArsR family transcriptional regulator
MFLTLSFVDPEDEQVAAATPQQLNALAHPLRNRLLFAVGGDGATVSQLAVRLRTNKGNVAHHLDVLQRVGLVRVSHTRQVRGGTERYFVRVHPKLRGPRGRGEYTSALLQAVAEEITASPVDSLLHLRRIRLTRAQAADLSAYLDRLVGGLTEAPAGEPTHGVLVSVFQSSR